MSFAELKKQSRLGNLTAKLVKEVEKMNKTSSMGDDRFWKIERDKSGNGYAVIRFLPSPQGEDDPYVQVWSHAFQGPGGWYIENSLTTLGGKDPLGELNTQLWATGNKSDQEVVRQRKRKLSYYSNIYVVKDPAHPENEGKVFLFKYGKKIFEKISSALKPEFEDESPTDAFDLWTGANFKLKVRMADGYPNYDKSEFETPSVLGGFEDEDLEELWKKCNSLKEFVSPELLAALRNNIQEHTNRACECRLCMEPNKTQAALVPCGHCLCIDCAVKVQVCQECSEAVKGTQKLFQG